MSLAFPAASFVTVDTAAKDAAKAAKMAAKAAKAAAKAKRVAAERAKRLAKVAAAGAPIYDMSEVQPAMRDQALREWGHLFAELPTKLLGLDTNAKTVKGQKKGFKTAILYLAPYDLSGANLCAMAFIAACNLICLFTAGKGELPAVIASRLRKTLFWLQYREQFLALLRKEIAALAAKADREGWTLVVRLNGTSDIRWENFGIIEAFPDVQFYDYSKVANRKNLPANYDLTFSYSGAPAFRPFVDKAVSQGQRIAVVFRNRKTVQRMLAAGETFLGLPLVDGDDSDLRHIDPRSAVVALYAKGKARKHKGPMVVG